MDTNMDRMNYILKENKNIDSIIMKERNLNRKTFKK